jgi:predicted 3-demethylubiquinone-9 3-methyltransferase (glyoxalase superfamily)
MEQKLTPNLWFDSHAVEAAEFYINEIFNGDGRIIHVANYPEGSPGPAGTPMVVEWEMAGMRFIAINGGPAHKLTEAFSIQVTCENQDEVDYYWAALTADGGEEGPCGWCKDKYGVSWQVTPKGMDEVFSDPDPEKARRAMQAMLEMKKIDIAALRAAAEGEPAATS